MVPEKSLLPINEGPYAPRVTFGLQIRLQADCLKYLTYVFHRFGVNL